MIEHLRRWCWGVAASTRMPLPALQYHLAALLAAQTRDFPLAERLFERAISSYRRHCDVERLAHARIQQLFVRLAARGSVVPLVDLEGPSERINRLRGFERPGAAATAAILPGQEQRREDARPRDPAADPVDLAA